MAKIGETSTCPMLKMLVGNNFCNSSVVFRREPAQRRPSSRKGYLSQLQTELQCWKVYWRFVVSTAILGICVQPSDTSSPDFCQLPQPRNAVLRSVYTYWAS